MKYISLFSGIGGFEQAIHKIFPDAYCLGYSEIKPSAIKVYETHFPNHKNLGDITQITDSLLDTLGNCDLIVAGFPCTNLSSLAHINGDNRGLEGKQSKLFYDMLRIIRYFARKNPRLHLFIENVASMSKANSSLIINELEGCISEGLSRRVYMTKIDSARFGVQTRKRLYWTTWPYTVPESPDSRVSLASHTQIWEDVLNPIESKINPISEKYINCLNKIIKTEGKSEVLIYDGNDFVTNGKTGKSRWQCSYHSDTGTSMPYAYPVGKSRPITGSTCGNHNVLVDRRFSPFVIRSFEIEEIERLFGYPAGYTNCLNSKTSRKNCLGNSVVVYVLENILRELLQTQ